MANTALCSIRIAQSEVVMAAGCMQCQAAPCIFSAVVTTTRLPVSSEKDIMISGISILLCTRTEASLSSLTCCFGLGPRMEHLSMHCREAALISSSKGRKKTAEELSVEVLLHFAGTVRAFYASMAKAVHAQGRRRDEPAVQPNASMKAASVTLGVILMHNLNPTNQVGQPWHAFSGIYVRDLIVTQVDS